MKQRTAADDKTL